LHEQLLRALVLTLVVLALVVLGMGLWVGLGCSWK
jgi:hypothetical protein